MKATSAMRMVLVSWIASLALGAVADGPTISDVVVRQRWPWSRLVDIGYVLTCDPADRADVSLTANNGTAALTIPMESLSGDLYGVSQGGRRIVWDPSKTAYTNAILTQFRANLTATHSPLYMIVDLTKTAGAEGQIEYIYAGDSRLATVARWTNVWFGVTNDSVYATDKLVLRRVTKGSFKMKGTCDVTLTKDYYVGVFEVTQRQWERVMGVNPSVYNNPAFYMTRPAETMTYNAIRGATNDTPAVNWPSTGYAVVSTNSFMGKLRAQTGLSLFDLPTSAQWEYACRAGTATVFNDGEAAANVSGANAYTNTWLTALARYKFGGGYLSDGVTAPANTCSPTNGTALVGSYAPNAWGVYDMHGNVQEYCLDWNWTVQTGETDPKGPLSSADNKRLLAGGGAFDSAQGCVSAGRNSNPPSSAGNRFGFRLIYALP